MADTSKVVLSPIPLDELIATIRETVRQELLQAGKLTPDKKVPDTYLTGREVARKLRITLPTLRAWQNSGRLPAHRIGRRILFKDSEIEASLQKIKTL